MRDGTRISFATTEGTRSVERGHDMHGGTVWLPGLIPALLKRDCSKCTSKLQILIGGPYTKNGENHPYGHAALRVVKPGSDQTYDFGRYGKVWGVGGSQGEGIMRVWSNFANYIAGEKATGRVTTGHTLCVTEAQADAIKQSFDEKLKGANDLGKSSSGYRKYRLAQDYDALGSNCTTQTLDGAIAGLPPVDDAAGPFNTGRGLSGGESMMVKLKGWPDHIFMPEDLNAYLKSPEFLGLALKSGMHAPCVDIYQK